MLQFIEPRITNFDAQLSTVRFLRARVLMYLQYTKLCNYILHLGESSLSIKNCGSRPRPGRCASVPEKRNRKSRPAQAVNPPRPTSVLVYLPKRRAHLIHPSLLPNEKQMDGTQDREKQIPSDAGVGTR